MLLKTISLKLLANFADRNFHVVLYNIVDDSTKNCHTEYI